MRSLGGAGLGLLVVLSVAGLLLAPRVAALERRLDEVTLERDRLEAELAEIAEELE